MTLHVVDREQVRALDREQVQVLEREQVVARPLAEVFDFFSRARNLERLTPAWLRFEVLTPEPVAMRAGTLIDYRLRLHGVPVRWRTRIEAWEENRMFVDRQLRGPYRLWHHRHEFEDLGGSTLVRDRVHYALPLGRLGEAAARRFVSRDLDRIFAFRREAVRRLLG
jgi:ligand-binding SRPBCC domain-containing protein